MNPVEHTLLAIRTNLTQIEQISERQWNPAADMQTARRPPRAAHTTPLNFDACQALADATDELQAVLYVLDLPIPHGWRRTITTLIDHAEELDPYQPILAAVETKTRAYANPPTSQDQILGHYLCCTPKQLDAYITATYRLTIPPSTIRSWLHRGKLHAKQLAPNTYLVPVKTLENTLRAESATASE